MMVEILRKTTEEEYKRFYCSGIKCKKSPIWLVRTSFERGGKSSWKKRYLCEEHLEPYRKDIKSEVNDVPPPKFSLWEQIRKVF